MRNIYRVKKYELDKYLEHFKQTYRFDNISRTPFSYDNFELISFVETPYGDRHLVRYTAYEYLFTANTRSFLLLSLNEKDQFKWMCQDVCSDECKQIAIFSTKKL